MAHNDHPYVGPRPFSEEDEGRFFGREEEVAEIVALIYSQPQVLLYAESGVGKTSLVNAGVLPRLRRDGLEVLPVARVRPRRASGLQTASRYMLEAISYFAPSRPASSLVDVTLASFLEAKSRPPSPGGRKTLRILFFDQLEEILIPSSDHYQQEQESFFLQIAAAVKSDPLIRVIFIVREDNLPRLESFAPFLPEGLGVGCRLDRLSPDAALAAIRQPLQATAWHFEEGVAERLVEDLRKMRVETNPGRTEEIVGDSVEPVQLQVVCECLWQSLPAGGGMITFKDLKRYADVNQTLSTFYESALQRAVAKGGEDEWKLRIWFDTKLITPAGTRGIVYRGPKETEGIRNSAVDILEEMHLLHGYYRAGAQWYELTHDRFIGAIQESNHRAQQPARLPVARAGPWRLILTLLGGVAAIGVLVLLWLTLPAMARQFVVRTLAVLIAAFLPGWLYVSFLRTRMRLLWDEYVLALFRLRVDDYSALPEPPRATRYHQRWQQAGGRADDTSNLYLRKFEATQGRGVLPALHGYGAVSVARQALTVVLLVGLLAGAGWWFVLRPDLARDQWLRSLEGLSGSWSTLGSALGFAFVGVYLTSLAQITNDYFGDHLSAATYVRMVKRILVVSVAVVLLHLLLSRVITVQVEFILAFLIGIFPQVGVQALKAVTAKLLGFSVPSLSPRFPLSDLDGLTISDEARLLEKGIGDMHALVTANLVDLLLDTRVPVGRLVDWVDQALLSLYIPRKVGGREPRDELRMAGIRTATDLIRVWDSDQPGAPQARKRISAILGDDEYPGKAAVEAILMSLDGSPNFKYVRAARVDDS